MGVASRASDGMAHLDRTSRNKNLLLGEHQAMFKIRERLYDEMAEPLQNDYFELLYVPTMIANRLLRNRFCGRSHGSVILVVHTILKNMPPCKYFILISLSVRVGRPAHSSLSVARFLLVSLVNFWQFIAIAKGRGRRMYCPFLCASVWPPPYNYLKCDIPSEA